MKSDILYAIFAFLFLLGLGGCSKTGLQEEGKGYLYVSLDRDDSEDIVFKSAPVDELVFSLEILDYSGGKVTEVEDYRSLAENPLQLNAGSYTVKAFSGDNADAAFDIPFYYGESELRIRPDEVSNLTIGCALANVKVSAAFSDDFKKYFTEYRLTVTNGKGELVFDSADGTIDRKGYFSATGSLSWTLTLTNSDGKVCKPLTASYTDVKAKQHYNLSFSVKPQEETGGGAVTIVVDDSLEEKEYDIDLDFGYEKTPVIEADFDISEDVDVMAGDSRKRTVSFCAPGGASKVLLTYDRLPGGGDKVTIDLVGASPEQIASLEADGFTVSSVEEGSTETFAVDITSWLADRIIGRYGFGVMVVDANCVYNEITAVFNVTSPVETEAVSASAWARFADLEGKWFSTSCPEGAGFQYRRADASQWSDFAGEIIYDDEAARYRARLLGLEADTDYIFRAVSAKDKETRELSFRTEKEGTLPNMNFDSWYQDGSVWYPNLSLSETDYFWDTANGGSKTAGVYPTVPEETNVISGKAARLESKFVDMTIVRLLAAGNIYTGKFVKAIVSIKNPGAELDWGVPFTARPLALKGFYHYLPKTVDQGNHGGMSGKTDIGQIQIMLTDWDKPFRVNTQTSAFVDVNDSSIIAYGSLDLNETEGYKDFTIELDYRDITRTPEYIVIVAAASKYGDYFTGGVGSTLYLDEFEFVYDPLQLKK